MLHIISIVWSVLNTVLRGFLLKTYWAWFVLTVFPTLPRLDILPAIGLSFFVAAISPWKTISAKDWEESRGEDAESKLAMGLINAGIYTIAIGISLGMGWVLHYIMKAYGY